MEFRRSANLSHYDSAESMMLYNNYLKNDVGNGVSYDMSAGGEFIPVEHYDQMPGVEFDLCTEYTESHTVLTDNCSQYGVTAVAFDLHEELIWIGKERGFVASYYGSEVEKHSAFRIHNTEEVRCISSVNCGILALTASSLRCQLRRGLPIFSHSSENLNEMQCLLPLNNQVRDSILMGGHKHKLIEFNLARGEEVNLIDLNNSSCAILRQHGNRFVCCGDPSGVIELRDPLTLKVEHSLEAHTGSLSDFDIHGNLLVTCGFSSRQGSLVVDRLLMVFDIRMMRSVSPIPILLDPLLLRFMPSFSSRLAVVSSLGQLQLVDTVPLSEPEVSLFQVNATDSLSLSFDVSTSCQMIAIGDSASSLHVFTSKPTPIINTLSRQTEFADPVETYPPISVTDELAVLAAIPLMYPAPTPLVSDWPTQFIKKNHRHHPPIDPEILRTMKMQGTIGYAPNPHSKRRNQIPYTQDYKSANRNNNQVDQRNQSSKEGDANSTPVFVAIPKRYRKLDMKYWKSGLDEFDFEQFNKTKFSGLEATLPNSYCNAMIQVLYFSEQLRQIVISHVCQAEFCLCCELAFLFHMLTISTGFPCHSGNFLRALRNAHEASALNLILPDQNNPEMKKKTNLVTLIQNWNRFILHQLHFELLEWKKRKAKESEKRAEFVYRDTDFPSIDLQSRIASKRVKNKSEQQDSLEAVSVKDEETEVSRLFGSKQLHVHRCLKCQHGVSRESNLLVCNLIYPESVAEDTEYTFCEVLKQSLCPEQTTPAWCDQCERFQPTLQSRQLKALPSLLTINCNIESATDKAFWQNQMDLLVKKALDSNLSSETNQSRLSPTVMTSTKPCRYGQNCTRPGCRFKHPGRPSEATSAQNSSNPYSTNSWLPLHIHLQLSSSGEVHISKLEKSEVKSVASAPKKEDASLSAVYDLSAVVCHVNDEKKNLVAIINTDHENELWHVFNDVSITPVTAQEAVWFSLDWKIPCVLYWSKHKVKSEEPPPLLPAITYQVFCEDVCLAQNNRSGITFVPLSADETPKSGELVAMDAEFVTLNQEEAELRSDGKLSTVKPSHMSVARVSVIRGQGTLAGTPFIDDYISTQEQVVDYLTKFSGIQPGDLNAASSSKHLTTLKSTYLKLRYLVDNGVKFVGHGLSNDFRVINLVVPAEQVIDTVNLFHLPHQRMVSLRFLAWHFLGMKIQAETHDSIEDAKAALQLYQLYLKFVEEGVVQTNLEEMYKVGKSCQWKVPGVDDVTRIPEALASQAYYTCNIKTKWSF